MHGDTFYPDVHLDDYRRGRSHPKYPEVYAALVKAIKNRREAITRLEKRGLKVSIKYIK